MKKKCLSVRLSADVEMKKMKKDTLPKKKKNR